MAANAFTGCIQMEQGASTFNRLASMHLLQKFGQLVKKRLVKMILKRVLHFPINFRLVGFCCGTFLFKCLKSVLTPVLSAK